MKITKQEKNKIYLDLDIKEAITGCEHILAKIERIIERSKVARKALLELARLTEEI